MMTKDMNGTPQIIVILIIAALVTWLVVNVTVVSRELVLPHAAEGVHPRQGRWIGTRFKQSGGGELPAMQVLMDVEEDGTLAGKVAFYPLNLPENAIDLVATNGCNVDFDALVGEDNAIRGVFTSATSAVIQIDVRECVVKFFGPIAFDLPIQGQFRIEYNERASLSLIEDETRVLTPIEVGIGVYANYCSACHGSYGQGAPGVPSLLTEEVRRKSDDDLLETINLGVATTGMPAWGNILAEDEKFGILLLLDDMDVLRD